jgi:hemerythrin-like domain-containing protein
MTVLIDARAPLAHDALLTLTHKAEAAARDGNRDRVESAALHLFETLVAHVDAERQALTRLPPGEHRLLARGQQRIIDLVVDLATEAASTEPCHCHDTVDRLLGFLTMQADDERLTFAREERRLARSASMGVTDPLRHEHSDLLPHVAELDAAAARLGDWNTDDPERLGAVVEFLRNHIVPHAGAEEAVLYPAVEEVMGAPGATDTMKADHVEVVRRTDELEEHIATIGAGPPTSAQAEQLRAQLYGLGAILRLHFAKEEDVLLPLLDANLSADDAAELFAKMGAVAHPQHGASS